MRCACGHRAISHRYMLLTRENGGECLAPQCPCGEMRAES